MAKLADSTFKWVGRGKQRRRVALARAVRLPLFCPWMGFVIDLNQVFRLQVRVNLRRY